MGAEVQDSQSSCFIIFWACDGGDDGDGDGAKIARAYAYLTGVKLGIAKY